MGVVIREHGEGEEVENAERNPPPVPVAPAPAPIPQPPPAPVVAEGNPILGGMPFRNGGLGAAHQALLQREGPAGFVPYLRPQFFFIRIILLLLIMCVSLSIASTIFLTLPGTLVLDICL